MLTPLKCIIQFGTKLLKSKDPNVVKEAELIVSTANLLLSQVNQILDKNMMDNNAFAPNYEFHPLNKTIVNIKFAVVMPKQEMILSLD
jgi:hypothetical protein